MSLRARPHGTEEQSSGESGGKTGKMPYSGFLLASWCASYSFLADQAGAQHSAPHPDDSSPNEADCTFVAQHLTGVRRMLPTGRSTSKQLETLAVVDWLDSDAALEQRLWLFWACCCFWRPRTIPRGADRSIRDNVGIRHAPKNVTGPALLWTID